MKKALIEPNGRIVEVRLDIFQVHPNLKWVDVPNDTTTRDTWNGAEVVKEVPPRPTLPVDRSNLDNHDRAIRAEMIAAAALVGKTAAEAKTAFKQAWDAQKDIASARI